VNLDEYMVVTDEQLAIFRTLQTPYERDHDDGYDAGGPVDPTKSEAYQFGQIARAEDEQTQGGQA
jgi:hypothetical protein